VPIHLRTLTPLHTPARGLRTRSRYLFSLHTFRTLPRLSATYSPTRLHTTHLPTTFISFHFPAAHTRLHVDRDWVVCSPFCVGCVYVWTFHLDGRFRLFFRLVPVVWIFVLLRYRFAVASVALPLRLRLFCRFHTRRTFTLWLHGLFYVYTRTAPAHCHTPHTRSFGRITVGLRLRSFYVHTRTHFVRPTFPFTCPPAWICVRATRAARRIVVLHTRTVGWIHYCLRLSTGIYGSGPGFLTTLVLHLPHVYVYVLHTRVLFSGYACSTDTAARTRFHAFTDYTFWFSVGCAFWDRFGFTLPPAGFRVFTTVLLCVRGITLLLRLVPHLSVYTRSPLFYRICVYVTVLWLLYRSFFSLPRLRSLFVTTTDYRSLVLFTRTRLGFSGVYTLHVDYRVLLARFHYRTSFTFSHYMLPRLHTHVHTTFAGSFRNIFGFHVTCYFRLPLFVLVMILVAVYHTFHRLPHWLVRSIRHVRFVPLFTSRCRSRVTHVRILGYCDTRFVYVWFLIRYYRSVTLRSRTTRTRYDYR